MRHVLRCVCLVGVLLPTIAVAQQIPPSPVSYSQLTESEQPAAPKTDETKSKKPAYDASTIAMGQSSFQNNCTQCHDADKSLQKKKSLHGWRSTIHRMAAKDGANIPATDFEAIAIYLTASQGNPADAGTTATSDAAGADDDEDTSVTTFATASPTMRVGNGDVQNRGFFPETWVGVSFQPKGFVSARATACLSCHNESGEGFLSRMEIVEAAIRFDFMQLVEPQCRGSWQASIDAGRFVVPFGAFASQVNPGVYRTVSKPLIYNMGMRVGDESLGYPVLPMPYSDEGANLSFTVPFTDTISASWDGYLVNGLQGDADGINIDTSREYTDNNRSPALGSRLTVGNQYLRFGSSIMGGRFASYPYTAPVDSGLTYMVFGADITARYKDRVRVQFEFAQRNTDRVVALPGMEFNREAVGGGYLEGELLLSRKHKISAIARYDDQFRQALLPPPGSPLATGNFTVSRLTYGFNYTLPGGSLLMLNHEHWYLPNGLKDMNVLGLRWAATF